MTQELWIAVYAAVLGLFQLTLAAIAPAGQKGYMKWNRSARDEPFELSPIAGRLQRAFKNFMETYVFFALIAVALSISHKAGPVSLYGAWAYFIARIVYVPCYAFGIAGVRSLVWIVSLAGLCACAVALLI